MSSGEKVEKTRGFETWLIVGRTNLQVHRALNRALAEVDLSLAQHEILVAIWQNSGLTQKQLSEKLLVIKSNVSALIKKLETRGLVLRTPDPGDTRNKRLTLTPAGVTLVRRSFALQNRIVDAMAAVMTDEELVMISDVMRRVGKAIAALERDTHNDPAA